MSHQRYDALIKHARYTYSKTTLIADYRLANKNALMTIQLGSFHEVVLKRSKSSFAS